MMPVVEARITLTTIVITPTPPGRRPAQTRNAENRSRAMFEPSSSAAISTNIGTATSV